MTQRFSVQKVKRMLCILLAIMMLAVTMMVPVSATTRTGSHYAWCKAHANNNVDMYITLAADFSGNSVRSIWWDSSYSHWPNGYTQDSTGSGYGYARGTYTLYSSLITEWVSIAFKSSTNTIYIYS